MATLGVVDHLTAEQRVRIHERIQEAVGLIGQAEDELRPDDAVADFRGVQVATINNTLGIVRDKLGVKTSREAIAAAQAGAEA